MTRLSTQRILDVPPKLVLEIAYGVEDPAAIAERYGFSDSEWACLKEYKPFVAQIEEKKLELRSSGYTFKMKSAIMAEDIMEDVYRKSKAEDSSFHTQLESLKFFAKAAGFESPQKTDAPTGPAFSITINLGGGKSVHLGTTAAHSLDNVVDIESEDYDLELGEIPDYIRRADASLSLEIE